MQNNIILPRNLAGFMELLPNEQIAFNKILDSFRAVFETNAFLPMDTPTLELSSVLLAKAGGETEKQVYRFSKGDTDMCMRFDLTVPLAKFVALNSAMLSFPFKRYQIGKSYRGERSQKGRFREFYQCDVDIIGEDQLSIISDAEIIDVLMSALKSIGLSDILVKISNRRLISGFLESLDIDEKSGDVLRLIDKIDKIGMELFKEEMAAIGLFDKTEKLLEFLSISGNDEETFLKLDNLKIDNQKWNNGLSELKAVFDALKSFGEDKNNYVLDIKTVRGLDYYTGTVFETISKSHPEFGSIGGGGRYENLAGLYSKRNFPGVGVSIGATRLFDLLRTNGLIDTFSSTLAKVAIIPIGEYSLSAIKIGAQLRQNGISTDVYYFEKNLKGKLNFANKSGVGHIILIGEEENRSGVYVLKNMQSGTQEKLSIDEIIEKLK